MTRGDPVLVAGDRKRGRPGARPRAWSAIL